VSEEYLLLLTDLPQSAYKQVKFNQVAACKANQRIATVHWVAGVVLCQCTQVPVQREEHSLRFFMTSFTITKCLYPFLTPNLPHFKPIPFFLRKTRPQAHRRDHAWLSMVWVTRWRRVLQVAYVDRL